MDQTFDKAARRAREWAMRSGLSDSNRTLCLIVSALAESLCDGGYIETEDVESLVLLGCELCRRLGESGGCVAPEACPLGLAASIRLVPTLHDPLPCELHS